MVSFQRRETRCWFKKIELRFLTSSVDCTVYRDIWIIGISRKFRTSFVLMFTSIIIILLLVPVLFFVIIIFKNIRDITSFRNT